MCCTRVTLCLGLEDRPEGQMSQFGAPPRNMIYSFKPPANPDESGEREKGEESKGEGEREVLTEAGVDFRMDMKNMHRHKILLYP